MLLYLLIVCSILCNNELCSGQGTWNEIDSLCECYLNYAGVTCEYPKCFGLYSEEACTGNGICSSVNFCECDVGYGGLVCDKLKCGDFLPFQEGVCSGHGNCIQGECECLPEYYGASCELPMCFGIPSTATEEVCSGHGSCGMDHHCECSSDWGGTKCDLVKCYGFEKTHTDVCSGHGDCLPTFTCRCDVLWHGTECEIPKCGGEPQTSDSVCSGHGKCQENHKCACLGDYGGELCSIPLCYGIPRNNDKVCGGNGVCNTETHKCECFTGFTGTQCKTEEISSDKNNDRSFSIESSTTTIIGSVTAGVGVLFVCCLMFLATAVVIGVVRHSKRKQENMDIKLEGIEEEEEEGEEQ